MEEEPARIPAAANPLCVAALEVSSCSVNIITLLYYLKWVFFIFAVWVCRLNSPFNWISCHFMDWFAAFSKDSMSAVGRRRIIIQTHFQELFVFFQCNWRRQTKFELHSCVEPLCALNAHASMLHSVFKYVSYIILITERCWNIGLLKIVKNEK